MSTVKVHKAKVGPGSHLAGRSSKQRSSGRQRAAVSHDTQHVSLEGHGGEAWLCPAGLRGGWWVRV